MRESGIFGSPRRSIIIGAGLFLTGLVAVVIPSLVDYVATSWQAWQSPASE